MKRVFFLILVSLLLGAFVYQETASHKGYVLISIAGHRVEMTFWTALLIWLASLLLLYLVSRLFSVLFNAGKHLGMSNRRARKRTARGLVDFIEGNWKQARKHLLKSAGKADEPLIHYLAAARSTYELGNEEEAFQLLHKAEQIAPSSSLAVALTQARMLLAAKKYEQCLAILERARKTAPSHPVVLELLYSTYLQLGDWPALRKLLPDLRRHKIASEEELGRLKLQIYRAIIKKAGERARLQSTGEGLSLLETEWQAIPSEMQHEPSLIHSYVHHLIKLGAEERAESFLRKELKRNWDDGLVAIYGRVKGADVEKQLLVAEHWQQERPGDASLLLALGRLCLRNEQWERARTFFESSLTLRKDPETYAELARLLAQLGEHETSTEYYQRGLLMSTAALPALPMPERREGSSLPHLAQGWPGGTNT